MLLVPYYHLPLIQEPIADLPAADRIITVNTWNAVINAYNNAVAGDRIVLNNVGPIGGAQLNMDRNSNNPNKPIVVCAAVIAQTTVTADINISGLNNGVYGLNMQGAQVSSVSQKSFIRRIKSRGFPGIPVQLKAGGANTEVSYCDLMPQPFPPGIKAKRRNVILISSKNAAHPGAWIHHNLCYMIPKPIIDDYSSGSNTCIIPGEDDSDMAKDANCLIEFNLCRPGKDIVDTLSINMGGNGCIETKSKGVTMQFNTIEGLTNTYGVWSRRGVDCIMRSNFLDGCRGGGFCRYLFIGNRAINGSFWVMAGNLPFDLAQSNKNPPGHPDGPGGPGYNQCNACDIYGNNGPLEIGHDFSNTDLPALNTRVGQHTGPITIGRSQGHQLNVTLPLTWTPAVRLLPSQVGPLAGLV